MRNQNAAWLKVGREFAFAKAKTSFASQSIYQQLSASISLERAGDTAAEKIVEGLRQTAVTSRENGMYLKAGPATTGIPAILETQALAIEVFSEIGDNEGTVEELKV
jgi:hypothetical protein